MTKRTREAAVAEAPITDTHPDALKTYLSLSGLSRPDEGPSSQMDPSTFLALITGSARRFFRLRIDSTEYGPDDTYVERDQKTGVFWTFERDRRGFDDWARSHTYGSPARPPVFVSPLVYGGPAATAPLHPVSVVWCTLPTRALPIAKGAMLPALDAAARRRAHEKIAGFPVSPSCVLDAGTALTCIWRLRHAVEPVYAARLVDRLAHVAEGTQLVRGSLGVADGVASLLAGKGLTDASNARRQQADADQLLVALKAVWWLLPAQRAAVQPAHTVDVRWLTHPDATVPVEEISAWAEAL